MFRPTETLSSFFSELRYADIPHPVRHEAKRLLLDTLGCGLAALTSEIAPVIQRSADCFGGPDVATMLGASAPQGLFRAIYANARLANALDFDETFPVGAHFGAGAALTALAFAEAGGLGGRELLTAIVAGYELGGRVASYIGPVARIVDGAVAGFPDIWGVAAPAVMAAAAASARARSLGPETFRQAIGIAGANSPLPVGAKWSSAEDLPNCKYCDAGWCAVTGAFATVAAAGGTTGFQTILDGPDGLAHMYGIAEPDEAILVEGVGQDWMLTQITYKPWPTCRFTHYPLTALQHLLSERGIHAGEVEEVVIETNPLSNSKRFTNPHPRTFASRQFSYPHMVAMLIRGIEPGPQWMESDKDLDPEFRALRSKVTVRLHPRARRINIAAPFNHIREMPGGVHVRTTRGEFYAETPYAAGDPWDVSTRWSDEQLIRKFMTSCPGSLGARIANAVMSIDESVDWRSLMEDLVTAAQIKGHACEST